MRQGTMLPGDVLLITAFISYVGCFTKQYRQDLLHKFWLPFLKNLDVSFKRGVLTAAPIFLLSLAAGVKIPHVLRAGN